MIKSIALIFLLSNIILSCSTECPDAKSCNTLEPTKEDLSILDNFKENDTIKYLKNLKDTLSFQVTGVTSSVSEDYCGQTEGCHYYFVSCKEYKVQLVGMNNPTVFSVFVGTWRRLSYNNNDINEGCRLTQDIDSTSCFGIIENSFYGSDYNTDSILSGNKYINNFVVLGNSYDNVFELNYPNCSGCIRYYFNKENGFVKFIVNKTDTFELISK